MTSLNYTSEIIVPVSPERAYRALTMEIDKWWSVTDNVVSRVGDEFTVRFDPTYWKFRVAELIPDKLIEWQCIEANHIVEGTSAALREEWLGTKIIWQITPVGQGSKIAITHKGLVPALECYGICERGWDHFFGGSLKGYLETGTGFPG